MSKKKKGQPVIVASDWKGPHPIGEFIRNFNVYPELTAKLDAGGWKFTQEIINEIALWKVARYALLPSAALNDLDKLRSLKPKEHRKGAPVLNDLLGIRGVGLPMASTFLRFANPQVFQIFDRHIYRALYGRLPTSLSKDPVKCLPIYHRFLDDLHAVCGKLSMPFSDSDRILFEFDKQENPPLNDR
jgi:thermostable 8-oxoguanine DNA glycosylase